MSASTPPLTPTPARTPNVITIHSKLMPGRLAGYDCSSSPSFVSCIRLLLGQRLKPHVPRISQFLDAKSGFVLQCVSKRIYLESQSTSSFIFRYHLKYVHAPNTADVKRMLPELGETLNKCHKRRKAMRVREVKLILMEEYGLKFTDIILLPPE